MTRADDQTFADQIEGYCGALSYAPGETVELHVSTHADRYDVTIERWGSERETVWSQQEAPGAFHAVAPNADASGCGWPVALTVDIDDGWSSGFYLVTLAAHGASAKEATAHACFVVRGTGEPSYRRSMLYVVPTNTWNAYNTWGGKSLYTGGTQVSFHRPFARGMLNRPAPPRDERDDRKARPTHFREVPDADGHTFQAYRTDNNYPSAIGSTGWFTHGRRFVEWAEAEGYRFDFATSADLEEPSRIDGYDAVLLIGHDEYWSAPMRSTIERFVQAGGSLASFSGNTMFWRVRVEDATHGTTMVCHKYRGHVDDPDGSPTGLWADVDIDEPEWTLLGAGSAFGLYHRFGQATPQGVGGFLVSRPDHWLFAETGLSYGDVLGQDDGAVGYEVVGCPITFDELQLPVPNSYALDRGVPESTEIVGWVPSSNLGVGEYPKSIAALSDQGDLEFIAERVFAGDPNAETRARVGNAVMVTCTPFGDDAGEVITIGTTDWVFALPNDAQVQQVTRNVLDRLTRP